VARSPRALTDTFKEIETVSTKTGVKVNTSKTKYLMRTPRETNLPQALAVVNHVLKEPMFSCV
jgi:hypothetical protein